MELTAQRSETLVAPVSIGLLAGLPRSGTTWLEHCLSRAGDVHRVHEPDNEDQQPFALRAKVRLARFPVLRPGDAGGDYARLWAGVFAGARRRGTRVERLTYTLHRSIKHPVIASQLTLTEQARLRLAVALAQPMLPDPTRPVLVKTVLACLCLDWIAEQWAPKVVVTVRHPLNCVSSWWRLGWRPPFDGDCRTRAAWPRAYAAFPAELRDLPPEPPPDRVLGRLAWQLAAILTAMHASALRHPEWRVARHEELVSDPNGVRALATFLGLTWTEEAQAFLEASNRPGHGTYELKREHSGETARWRERLSESEAAEVLAVLAGFPNADWLMGRRM